MPHDKVDIQPLQESHRPSASHLDSDAASLHALQRAAFRMLPCLKNVAVSEAVWREIADFFRERERERVSRASLLYFLERAGVLTHSDIKSRHSERIRATAQETGAASASVEPSRRRKRPLVYEEGDNQFVLQSESQVRLTPIKKTGVRVAALEPSKTGGSFLSPGGHEYRSFYKSARSTLFLPVTPDAKKPHAPHQLPSRISAGKRATTRHFTVTEQTVHTKKARGLSQKQLAGLSCQEMFRAHGMSDFALHGRNYHWSHLVGLLLGGEHAIENMVPGTAESNLNTLHAVERRILQLLQEGVMEVDMVVTPRYPKDPDILLPKHVHFQLAWSQAGRTHSETLTIYTVSRRPLTRSMRDALQLIREADAGDTSPKAGY
ncbi:hypothetical protein Lgee_1613 [Legionella geestiana]|uniref:Type VII secretion system protein EssD-like domain-containing protein n=1 Tax=Legionella geestiana TaxID=45065 RepID=A0A0W0TSW7_9GAMM|nr:DNA/RNA non-specific endonuclease [Legionella geestiana]KTC98536.1 hypothetical protein Lgee_1613 [Legionella geestiana]QBS13062.1 hypothetical protein E4T54_10115 [Legionella geestiana]STX54424.1 Uncharacterised protein [Legionella geestiana]